MTEEQANDLKSSLYDLMQNIESKEPILEQLEDIGRIQAEISPTAPSQLIHYLERRSYAKALEFLQLGVVHEHPNRPQDDEGSHS
ncbi:hypothetical protein MK139_05365 [bacterium]|jgi:hypothetical protein|nr:hypothetical protein [bacterium]